MKAYKYLCTFCGDILISGVFLGIHGMCKKCGGRMVLMDANELRAKDNIPEWPDKETK